MPATLHNGIPIPELDINFVPAKAGEVLKLGPLTCRIMEDGSNTDNRLGVAELIMPPKTPGPPPHWHEMHDETFFVTQGNVRFHVPEVGNPGVDKKVTDAKVGDYMVVPIRAPHTFSNPFDEEARMFFTSTPSFYINYFKLLSTMGEEGKPMPAEVSMTAMAMYATTVVDKQPRKAPE
ncbi:hypothetical protein KC340_g12740 [Hortaea werneckii]|nr:hypothetical protein KC342_g13037 [Hortaea werneckii]KAI7095323.1 hypothetical protein KC339_g11097 [Hortaea werneckii]KAI7225120.1 hypothetical protein KC365_g10188 [Hortaea werneckii]KAI7302411.1 hypothetical protein KC340_g12740 [Hortaea werneckii]KAI7393483.1 hypothetical protein KC328_g6587 [Hortaea werneckii]